MINEAEQFVSLALTDLDGGGAGGGTYFKCFSVHPKSKVSS